MDYINSNPSFQSFHEPVSTSRANLIMPACPFFFKQKKEPASVTRRREHIDAVMCRWYGTTDLIRGEAISTHPRGSRFRLGEREDEGLF